MDYFLKHLLDGRDCGVSLSREWRCLVVTMSTLFIYLACVACPGLVLPCGSTLLTTSGRYA